MTCSYPIEDWTSEEPATKKRWRELKGNMAKEREGHEMAAAKRQNKTHCEAERRAVRCMLRSVRCAAKREAKRRDLHGRVGCLWACGCGSSCTRAHTSPRPSLAVPDGTVLKVTAAIHKFMIAAQDAAEDVGQDVAQDVVQDLVHTTSGGAAQSASISIASFFASYFASPFATFFASFFASSFAARVAIYQTRKKRKQKHASTSQERYQHFSGFQNQC